MQHPNSNPRATLDPIVREGLVGTAPLPTPPSRSARWALLTLEIGAVLVVLAAVTDRDYELDRFFVPKELVLHLTALIAGILAAGAFRRVRLTRVDALLGAYLLVSVASAALAGDRELAIRAVTMSVSGVVVFWVARAVREAGLSRPLLRVLAMAGFLAAAMSLLQAYGVSTDFFSENRAPGGTLGNRNFVAHMAAFTLPVVLLSALRAWRPAGFLIGSVGVAVVLAALVLTRSRAGWLAFGAAGVVLLGAMLLSPPLRRHAKTWRRLAGTGVLVALGVAGALLLPNSLRWRSENPYLESVTGLVNYQEGSGRGRLVQYRRSMAMAADNPLLGVGPGNWSEEYPEYAAPNDPSMDPDDRRTTANPWPSSDWVASIAERGALATLLLTLALAGVAVGAFRRLVGARDNDEGIVAAALLATLAATLVAGLFDAVLLLAAPTLLVWAALGALWDNEPMQEVTGRSRLKAALLIVGAVAAGAGVASSVAQLREMEIIGSLGRAESLALSTCGSLPSGACGHATTGGFVEGGR